MERIKTKKARLRLALVIGQLGYGGAEKQHVYDFVTRLDRSEFEPIIFCLSEKDKPYGEKLRRLGFKVHTLKRHSSFDPIRVFKLARLFREEKIELVHSLLYIATVYCFFACKLSGVGIQIASVLGYRKSASPLRRFLDRTALAAAAQIIANSHDLRNYLVQDLELPADKIETVPDGVPLERFSSFRPKEELKKELAIACPRVAGIVSRKAQAKNIPLFIETAKYLLEQGEDICFVLAGLGLGEGERREWLGDYPRQERFFFLGTRDDIPDLLNMFDVFVLSSRSEGLPGAIIEAMAAGKPVAATDVGGCRELVREGETGLLVPSGDKTALARAVKTILEDEQKAALMGKNGREFVARHFSLERKIEKITALYRQTLEKYDQ